MEHSEKIEVTPKETNFKKHTDKLTKLLKIILKLARINGYDYIGRIKNKDGNFIENSNLIQLLNHSMMSSRVLVGESDFIRLLFEANVEPELITNDNVRVKLSQLYSKNQKEKETEPQVYENHIEVSRPLKRKYDFDNDDEYVTIKRKKTDMPNLQPYKEIPINPSETMPQLTRIDDDDDQKLNNRKRKRTWIFPDDA